jgi:hydroxymethylpyrimidine/phosphomethylpyrimidine kinase
MAMQTEPATLPVALSIAGSDSGGGAGIQADLKTFHAFGVFGTTAITAITVQDTLGVHGVHAVPDDVVRAQVEVVARDLRPAACKSGMLATRTLVRTVAAAIEAERLPNYVLDPVMVATSGDRLLDADAESAIREQLIPLAVLVTPNLDEAAVLAGTPVGDERGMTRAAETLLRAGAAAVLVKGGHLTGQEVIDVLHDGRRVHRFRRPRLRTRNTHGTGCTLSAAIAAGLARGEPLVDAVAAALEFVHRAMSRAPALGAGHGPLNHLLRPRRASDLAPPEAPTSSAR